MKKVFSLGDRVRVKYGINNFYDGRVVQTIKNDSFEWVSVKPDNPKIIATFASAHERSQGFQSYIVNDPVIRRVTKI